MWVDIFPLYPLSLSIEDNQIGSQIPKAARQNSKNYFLAFDKTVERNFKFGTINLKKEL